MKALEIRASYSHAFARFVTGFCDIQQPSMTRKTMYEMAKLIHLPEAFVTLRHRIVHHQKTPTLKTLELNTAVALGWLRSSFWKRIHNPDKLPLEQIAEEPTMEEAHQIQAILKQYLKARKNEIRNGEPAEEDESAAAYTSTKSLLMLCDAQAGSQNYAASILVGDSLIFPTQNQGSPNMRGAYEIWDPLLNEMSYHTRLKFAYCIINRLHQILIELPRVREVHDTRRMIAVEWLCHLLEPGSSMCGGTFLTEQRDKVMENCFLHPNYWNSQLAAKLIDGAEPHFKRKWRSYLDDTTKDDDGMKSDHSDEGDFNKDGRMVYSLPSEVGGWSRVEPWTPTRIGTTMESV